MKSLRGYFYLDGGAGSGGDGSGDAGDKGDGNTPAAPTTVEEWKALYDKTVGDHETQVEGLTTENVGLKKSVGDQGNELGEARKLKKRMDDDALVFVREFAAEKELPVRVGDEKDMGLGEILKKITDGDLDSTKGLAAIEDQIKSMTTKGLNAAIKEHIVPVREQELINALEKRYPDWKGLEESRSKLEQSVEAGSLSPHELIHLATRGSDDSIKAMLTAHEEKMTQKITDQIFEKIRSQAGEIPADVLAEISGDKGNTNILDVKAVAAKMSSQR